MSAFDNFINRLEDPSADTISKMRQTGIRPEVMMCFYYNKTCLIARDSRWKVWTFPQGGIDEGETVREALERETKEELGKTFFEHITHPQKYELIGHGAIPMPPNPIHKDPDKRNLIAKHFFVYTVRMKLQCNSIKSEELKGFRWETYHELLKYIKTINSQQKKKLLIKSLDVMRSKGYL